MHETAEQMQERIVELQGELATARRDNLYLRDKAAGMDALRKENDTYREMCQKRDEEIRKLKETLAAVREGSRETASDLANKLYAEREAVNVLAKVLAERS